MFNSSRKTIGLFINRPELDFPRLVCKSMAKYSKEFGFNLAVFSSFEVRGENNSYETMESDIVSFAPIEELDAIVVALDTFDTPDLRNTLLSGLKKRAKCPVISYREQHDDFYSAISDANNAVGDIIKHLAEIHGLTRIAFMAGYRGHYDGEQRLETYYKTMNELGLDVTEGSVFYGDMWKAKSKEAADFFFGDGGIKPEAVVCANDFMARTLCDELIERGIKVPEEVKITGVDNLDEAYNIEPRLTTIAVDCDQISKDVVLSLEKYFKTGHLEKIVRSKTKIMYRESCGCKECRKNDDFSAWFGEAEYYVASNRQTFFSFDMSECIDLYQIKETIRGNLESLGIYKEFYYFSLINSIDEDVNLKKKNVKATYRIGVVDNEIKDYKIKFEKKNLVPDEFITDDDFKMYYFRILHNRNKTFGYAVFRVIDEPYLVDFLYHEWCLTLSITINTLFIRDKMQSLITENYESSVKDHMTTLYNRRGFESFIEDNWQEWSSQKKEMFFISVDLDGLKTINDKYGHLEGDFAIQSVANALRGSVNNIGIAARVGGDEFCAIVDKCDIDVVNRVTNGMKRRIKSVNATSGKPYLVDFSIGFYRTIIDENTVFDDCMTNSDFEMYKMKNIKKQIKGEKNGN